MNTCDHYNYVKTKAYAESLEKRVCKHVFAILTTYGETRGDVCKSKKTLPLKSSAFHNCN